MKLHHKTKDLTHQRFSSLVVLRFLEYRKRNHDGRNRSYWECCCDCGNTVIVSGNMLVTKQRTSCGCLKKQRALKNLKDLNSFQKGKLHPSWNHDLSDDERELNRNRSVNPQLKDWRVKVYRSYNWMCIKCESKKRLCAHHIFNWSEYKKLRFDLNNGALLCEECHKLYHHIHGYKNNNLKELLLFLDTKG